MRKGNDMPQSARPGRLAGKVALVTGAASGLGLAGARAMAQEGARLLMTDMRDGADLAAELREAGHQAEFLAHDIADPADWDRAIAMAAERHGRLDVLVNNAGLSGSGLPDVTALDVFDRLVAVNLRGAFLGLRAAVPLMRARGGSIVNVCSIAAVMGTPGVHIGYHASKGGLAAMTRAAAAEYGPLGIRVNNILPGVMPPMSDRPLPPGSTRDRIVAQVPLGRRGEVGDIAQAMVYLASDESGYVTGTDLVVDGGFSVV